MSNPDALLRLLSRADRLEALSILVRCVAPFMPHLSEECWSKLGGTDLCVRAPWPKVEESLLVEDSVTLPVQVNGKRRDEITVPANADKDLIESTAMTAEGVVRAIDGLTVRKVIVVPGRIVNIVAN